MSTALTSITDWELINAAPPREAAGAGEEYIYLLFMADDFSVAHKVPFYVGRTKNYVSRFNSHTYVLWHNAIFRRPVQALVMPVRSKEAGQAEQALISRLTKAGFILTNASIEDKNHQGIQREAKLSLWSLEEMESYKLRSPSHLPEVAAWKQEWEMADSVSGDSSVTDAPRPRKKTTLLSPNPDTKTMIASDYPTDEGATLAWGLLGQLSVDNLRTTLNIWDECDRSGIYPWELVWALEDLETSTLWRVNEFDNHINVEYTGPVADVVHRRLSAPSSDLELLRACREIHQPFKDSTYLTLPTVVEFRNEALPSLYSMGRVTTVLIALCLSDGEKITNPYHFAKVSMGDKLPKEVIARVKWHQETFGCNPGIRVVYSVTPQCPVKAESLTKEAVDAGYKMLTDGFHNPYEGHRTGLGAGGAKDDFEYLCSSLPLYEAVPISETECWERASVDQTREPAVVYSLTEAEQVIKERLDGIGRMAAVVRSRRAEEFGIHALSRFARSSEEPSSPAGRAADTSLIQSELGPIETSLVLADASVYPVSVEVRKCDPEPVGYGAKAVIAFCFNDGEVLGHPYHFTWTTNLESYLSKTTRESAWHAQKFGRPPGVRIVHLPTNHSVVDERSFMREAMMAGYLLSTANSSRVLQQTSARNGYEAMPLLSETSVEELSDSRLEHYRTSFLSLYGQKPVSETIDALSVRLGQPEYSLIPYALTQREWDYLGPDQQDYYEQRMELERERPVPIHARPRGIPVDDFDSDYGWTQGSTESGSTRPAHPRNHDGVQNSVMTEVSSHPWPQATMAMTTDERTFDDEHLRVPLRNHRPVRPHRDGEIALPPLFPKPVKKDSPYGLSEWDDI